MLLIKSQADIFYLFFATEIRYFLDMGLPVKRSAKCTIFPFICPQALIRFIFPFHLYIAKYNDTVGMIWSLEHCTNTSAASCIMRFSCTSSVSDTAAILRCSYKIVQVDFLFAYLFLPSVSLPVLFKLCSENIRISI